MEMEEDNILELTWRERLVGELWCESEKLNCTSTAPETYHSGDDRKDMFV